VAASANVTSIGSLEHSHAAELATLPIGASLMEKLKTDCSAPQSACRIRKITRLTAFRDADAEADFDVAVAVPVAVGVGVVWPLRCPRFVGVTVTVGVGAGVVVALAVAGGVKVAVDV
jgi:hypothetical protein